VRAATLEHERLVDSLLVLARGQAGLLEPRPVDLAALARAAVAALPSDGVRVRAALSPAPALGDAALLERLVGNLLDNAVRYNVPGGWVRVRTGTSAGRAVLEVANSGPVVPAGRAARLFEPFRRGTHARTGTDRGAGLGLSIVTAIAAAHGGSVTAAARIDGGLAVLVALPGTATR
jgi:signal transduction histidine kinase